MDSTACFSLPAVGYRSCTDFWILATWSSGDPESDTAGAAGAAWGATTLARGADPDKRERAMVEGSSTRGRFGEG